MLTITIPAGGELYDEVNNIFINSKGQTLQLEHSLVSLSKWESKWHKPFLSKTSDKTSEETVDYVRCMTITQNVDPNEYLFLTDKNLQDIQEYIDAPMTATVFSRNDAPINNRIITSEIIYYWMIAFQIPFECQKWHLKRLLTLVEVCNRENQDPKKMSEQEVMRRNNDLNEARKKALHTKG